MKLKNLYDLYDGSEKIGQNMTGSKIAELIGVRRETVAGTARTNSQIKGRYTVEMVGKVDDYLGQFLP